MEEYNFSPEECHLNLLDVDEGELISQDISSTLQGKTLQKQSSLSSECTSKTLSSNSYISFERPTKLLKKSCNISNSSSITENFSPKLSFSSSPTLSFQSSQILSFDKSNPSPTTQFYGGLDCTLTPKQHEDEVVSVSHLSQLGNTHFSIQAPNGSSKTQKLGTKATHCKRSLAPAPDHVMAERKRREKLNQSLIALAALVPGIKKMDKASVLENTVRYVKELKDRLAVLEEESNKKTKAECVVVLMNKHKPELYGASDSSSCHEISTDAAGGASSESVLQVESKASGQEVLLRIHCQKQEGILVKILAEIQSLHLFVLSSSVLPFGDSILEITIIAQMGEGYNLTLNELVKNIRVATLKLMS